MGQIVFSDVDGVLTDSKINIGENGELFKSFNVKDGYGIVEWTSVEENEFVIVTSRESTAVKNRASELGITEVHQGVNNKRQKLEEVANRLGFEFDNAAYIGDDLSDLAAIKAVSIGCCPADAPQEVKRQCEYISQYDGGEGAVRDLINRLQKSGQTAVGVICTEYDCTELAEGPLTDIDGKPMIKHVLNRVNRAESLKNVIVLTDNESVVNAVESSEVTVLMSDSDQDSRIDQVGEVAQDLDSEFIIDIPWNEPLLDPSLINVVVDTLTQKPRNVATPISSVNQKSMLDDDQSVKVVTDVEGKALYLSRSRIPYGGRMEKTYENVGVYGFEKNLLIECTRMDSDLETAEGLGLLRLLEHGYDIQTMNVDYNSPSVHGKKDIPLVEELIQEAEDYGIQE